MIGYTMVGTRDLDKSQTFYDPLFTEMGLDPCWRDEQVSSWGKADDATVPRFFTGYPFDETTSDSREWYDDRVPDRQYG